MTDEEILSEAYPIDKSFFTVAQVLRLMKLAREDEQYTIRENIGKAIL